MSSWPHPLLAPAPSRPPEEASNDNPLRKLMAGFVTAARMFQQAEGCTVSLRNTAIGRSKERVPNVSLIL